MESSDNLIKLAFSMQSNKGVYALLLGSGISISAGIPTGWGVVCDLINKLARLHGENPGEKCWEWYEKKFDKPADYSDLLDFLADTPTQRAKLLTSYFEPNDEEKKSGKKLPTPAHKAIAKLIEQKFVKVIITTNFDRLLEKALSDLNINPRVVSSSDDIEGLPSLVHMERPLIIKVNGDYLDSRIKNTPEELENYTSEMNQLLTEIFSEYGLIISGWSARYDSALIECYEQAKNTDFITCWIDPFDLSEPALKLLSLRNGRFIKEKADIFFPELAKKLRCIYERSDKLDVPNNLPEGLSSFIGREKEISEILELEKKHRMITLVGPAGVGKTRLAIEIAKRLSSSSYSKIWFINLSLVSEKIQVYQIIFEALGIRLDYTESSIDAIINAIKNTKCLIIFDNCEQVINIVSQIAKKLLNETKQLKIIATSRETLNIEIEARWYTPVMEFPERSDEEFSKILEYSSIKLFYERAKTVSSDFVLDENNIRSVVNICIKLDGLPLAIELASARTKVLSVKQIEKKLARRFKLLTKSFSRVPDRQKTLKGAIDWSFDLLSDDEKKLLTRVSVFTGGFSLESSVAVFTGRIYKGDTGTDKYFEFDEFEVLDLIQQLVSKSLIISKKSVDGNIRYSLLESIKKYGMEKLETFGEMVLIHDRHSRWFDFWINSHTEKLRTSEQFLWQKKIEFENENILAALDYLYETKRLTRCARIISGVSIFWDLVYYNELGYTWTKKVIETDLIDDDGLLGLMYNCNGAFLFNLGRDNEAISSHEKALKLFEKTGNKERISMVSQNLALSYKKVGKISKCVPLLEKAIKASIDAENDYFLAVNRMNLGDVYFFQGDFEKSMEQFEKSISIFRKLSDQRMILMVQNNFASAYYNLLNLPKMKEVLDEMYPLAKSISYTEYVDVLRLLCDYYLILGEYDKATNQYKLMEKLRKENPTQYIIEPIEYSYSAIMMEKGNFDDAYEIYVNAGLFDMTKDFSIKELMLMLYYSISMKDKKLIGEIIEKISTDKKIIPSKLDLIRFVGYKATFNYLDGKLSEALVTLKKVIFDFYKIEAYFDLIKILEMTSIVFCELGDFSVSAMILGKMKQLRSFFGTPLSPARKPDIEKLKADLNHEIGDDFEKMMVKGSKLTTEEIIKVVGCDLVN